MRSHDWLERQWCSRDPYRLTFDGINDNVSIPYSSSLDFGTGDFAVEVWEKSSYTGGYQSMFAKDTAASGNGIDLYINQTTGTLRTWVGGTSRNGSLNIANGAWHQIVVVRNSGIVTHYIDGVIDGSGSATGNTNTASSKVWIGRTDDNVYYFNGSLPVVAVYNRALTQPEVLQNCNARKGRYSGSTCN
ncbi:MAG: LamG domain-containing protein [Proteobacteria bacterium]|nr:LamG domain-containing protein [Pseudomonadota bacterium]